MSTRLRYSLRASALVLVLWGTASGSAAAQGWSPSRLPDGQPDIQGIWQGGPARNAGHSLEEGCCDPEHNRMQSRAANNIGLR